MIASIHAATVLGATGQPVTVEVHVGEGLPTFQIVGQPDTSCREARDRVRAAMLSSGLPWCRKRITVNLAPASVKKGGSGLDIAIAIGVLVADGQVPADRAEGLGFIGELGLDGTIRAVPGVVPMVAALDGLTPVVARTSWFEARAIAGDRARTAATLGELVIAMTEGPWPPRPPEPDEADEPPPPDLADVRGQPEARRALEVAAAGGHHLLLVGPPGSGKTMIAQRLAGLLPALDPVTALEVTMVHSAAGIRLPERGIVTRPTFRAPHHSSTMVSLVGGGSHTLRPGEISVSHGGILFLDELGEFAPTVLDALRQPLEEGVVRVARAHASATLPARFLMVAATNPCPCGGGPPGACECDEGARLRYLRRLSGPLLDRFDLRVGVRRTSVDDLLSTEGGEPTATVRSRVQAARERAERRQGSLNASLAASGLDEFAPLAVDAAAMLRGELELGRLTGRGYHRIRRVARTIADLQIGDQPVVQAEHVAMALTMRVRLSATSRRDAA